MDEHIHSQILTLYFHFFIPHGCMTATECWSVRFELSTLVFYWIFSVYSFDFNLKKSFNLDHLKWSWQFPMLELGHFPPVKYWAYYLVFLSHIRFYFNKYTWCQNYCLLVFDHLYAFKDPTTSSSSIPLQQIITMLLMALDEK